VSPSRCRSAAGSVDLVTAAQAFHWFDVDRARAECLRVLAPPGKVALIWNDRDMGDPLHPALDEVFKAFGGAKWSALVAHEDRSHVQAFFGSARQEVASWPHEHAIDGNGLVALAFSPLVHAGPPFEPRAPGRRTRCAGSSSAFARIPW
jgi:SAM-dependent methyltransferase